jgi:serine protease Do
MKIFRCVMLGWGLAVSTASLLANGLPELFEERLKSVVAMEFFVQTEIERHPVTIFGTVIDEAGTVIFPAGSISPQVPANQLREFKVYRPNSTEAFSAQYLGPDALTGWHYVQVEDALRSQLVPVTRYPRATKPVRLSDELWGIGLRNRDEDFLPYFLSGRVATVIKLPHRSAVLGSVVATPGLPVFTMDGEFAGLALPSFGQNYLFLSELYPPAPVVLVNIEESSVVLLPDEVLPYLDRRPTSVSGRPIAWLGVSGLQPMASEVGKILKLEQQSGVVLSDIAERGPAAVAGLAERDIVLAIDGQVLPRVKPDQVVVAHFEREILRRRPGDVVNLTVRRGTETHVVRVTLGDAPKLVREASRAYFDRLGFTAREFVHADAVANREPTDALRGVVVPFVKPGSPAETAGLSADDWIQEVDGEAVSDYAVAISKLEAIAADRQRAEFVLLVSRAGETSVLRIKLN